VIREIGLGDIGRNAKSVVTLGTFDGVHRGHRSIIEYLLVRANQQEGPATVVTFDPHPREIVKNERMPLLTTIAERADILESLGIDRFIVLRFTEQLARMSARAFVEEVLVGAIGMQEIVIGYDHAFGRNREGDAGLLRTMGPRHHFKVDVIPAQVVDQHVVSSSKIRRALEEGRLEDANAMLGRPYRLSGEVITGDRRGRTIGFPTANLRLADDRKIVPAFGVYAVSAESDAYPETFFGMMNIGTRPTVDGRSRSLEVNLFGFEGDLYGRELHVEFLGRLRDERRFDSLEGLRQQLQEDRARCKALLESLP
jgi:riboflavin kinase / FMN adenylyltransferase